MFGIFKKKVKFSAYGKYSPYNFYGVIHSTQVFYEYGIKPPLGIEAYGTGFCIFKLGNNSYVCTVLALDTEVFNKDIPTSGSIYLDSLDERSYVEPYKGEYPNAKQLSGYMRTYNVPDDFYREWVETMKKLEEIKVQKKT